jgi:acetylornithine deacetylase/succinyl-diaminopimelate desuccinylase-like protein
MSLSRNTKRRLALYGSATVVAAVLWGGVVAVRRFSAVPATVNVFAQTEAAQKTESYRLLVEYLKIDTSNPPGHTRRAVEFLARMFACEGIPYEILGDDPERPILAARLKGSERGEALLLLNHMDVVPSGDLKDWVRPPFAAEMGDRTAAQYLYGRGTLDMKGQTVAALLAMASLKRAGILPRRDILFLAESGEEVFEPSQGIGWVADHRPDFLEGVAGILNEGGVNEVLGNEIVRYGIEVMQKAIVSVWADARTREELEAFKAFLAERDGELPARLTPPVHEFLRFIAPGRSQVWGRYMVGTEDAASAKKLSELGVVPEVYRSVLKDSIYAGGIGPGPSGGFTMRVVRTLLPGSSVKEQQAELLRWMKEHGLSSRSHFVTQDASFSPAGGRLWRTLNDVLGLDPERAPVGPYVLNGSYSTSSYIRARGFVAFGVSPFKVNYLDAAKIHNANERISLPAFVEGVERMARIVADYATAP